MALLRLTSTVFRTLITCHISNPRFLHLYHVLSMCLSNWPFSLPCNGHGNCNITSTICLCNAGFTENVVDVYIDPSQLPCFGEFSVVFWVWFALLSLLCCVLVRLMIIVMYWLHSCWLHNISLSEAASEFRCKYQLQLLLLKIVATIMQILFAVFKLFASSPMALVGRSFTITLLYSLTWLMSFAQVIVKTSNLTGVLQQTLLAVGDPSSLLKVLLRNIQRLLVFVYILALISFSTGPISFAFPLAQGSAAVSYFIFGGELAMSIFFMSIVQYFLLNKLVDLLRESCTFLES